MLNNVILACTKSTVTLHMSFSPQRFVFYRNIAFFHSHNLIYWKWTSFYFRESESIPSNYFYSRCISAHLELFGLDLSVNLNFGRRIDSLLKLRPRNLISFSNLDGTPRWSSSLVFIAREIALVWSPVWNGSARCQQDVLDSQKRSANSLRQTSISLNTIYYAIYRLAYLSVFYVSGTLPTDREIR